MSPPNKVEKSGSMDYGHRKGSGTMFAGLQQYKREDGPASQHRRESLQDTKPKGGLFSNFWDNTFRHGGSSPK